ncbi:MAG: PDZ domain-containing protein [Sandaracinaceae bacterium]|nr:PDZ domain-containing protein [Sandaracinaceae bacterium]
MTRGWLGASLTDPTPELARSMGIAASSGAVVMDVLPQSPASGAGLRRGDLITRLDSEAIRSSRQLRNLVATRGAGTAVRITRVRGGQPAEVRVTLVERPRAQVGPAADGTVLDTAGATEVGGLLVQPPHRRAPEPARRALRRAAGRGDRRRARGQRRGERGGVARRGGRRDQRHAGDLARAAARAVPGVDLRRDARRAPRADTRLVLLRR